jgi:hypothetical protein
MMNAGTLLTGAPSVANGHPCAAWSGTYHASATSTTTQGVRTATDQDSRGWLAACGLFHPKQPPIIIANQRRLEPGLKPFLRKFPLLNLGQNDRPDQDLASRIVLAFAA